MMPSCQTIGWDVGGAHLKVAGVDADGNICYVAQYPCPLWQGLDHLHEALDQALSTFSHTTETHHVVTMTGELVDYFPNRAAGVSAIIETLQTCLPVQPLSIFAGHGGLLTPAEAMQQPESCASANWLATASWLSQQWANGLLIDIGSTTTDLILWQNNQLQIQGYSDFTRLRYQELLYTGVVRTPVIAITHQVPFQGHWQPLMAEHFATTADIYRLTGQLPDSADQLATADGAPKTVDASARRLARLLGTDFIDDDRQVWLNLAHYLADRQFQQLAEAVSLHSSRLIDGSSISLIGAGCGRFLVPRLAALHKHPCQDFAAMVPVAHPSLCDAAAMCAPAVSVALIAQKNTDTFLSP